MKTTHTPEPWIAAGSYIVAQRNPGGIKHHIAETSRDQPAQICIGNADRIVACVNACSGIVDPKAVPDLLAALECLVDDMTEAHADELSDNHSGDGPDCSYCRNIALAQAAIAKAKGSTS